MYITDKIAMIDMSTAELLRIKAGTTDKVTAGLGVGDSEWDRLRVLDNILAKRTADKETS
jgi:hypothetical protein